MLKRHRHHGFSIIELVLVILIIGLIASVLIPNLIDAIHKAKQRRTMGELRLVGGAWMSWYTDHNSAMAAGSNQLYAVDTFKKLSYLELYGYLHPTETFYYIQEVPSKDAWGSGLTFYLNQEKGTDRQLLLCAAARENIFETCNGTDAIPIGPFIGTDFDQDIVWADGFLVRWPEVTNVNAN